MIKLLRENKKVEIGKNNQYEVILKRIALDILLIKELNI